MAVSKSALASDVVFLVLVSLLMLKMRIPEKGARRGIAYNAAFWVYVGYWLKTGMTVARLVVFYQDYLDHRIITIAFNCSGSMLVSLSTVSPLQLFFHYRLRGNFARMVHVERLRYCVGVVVVYTAAFALSLIFSLGCEEFCTDLDVVLIGWRIWFFVNASVEAFFLISCLIYLQRVATSKKANDTLLSLRRHLLITLYMRFGIAGTIVLKLLQILPPNALGSMHLWFIFTGLLSYHLRTVTIRAPRVGSAPLLRRCVDAVVAFTKRTDHQLLFSDAEVTGATPICGRRGSGSASQTSNAFWPPQSPKSTEISWVDDGVSPVPAELVVV